MSEFDPNVNQNLGEVQPQEGIPEMPQEAAGAPNPENNSVPPVNPYSSTQRQSFGQGASGAQGGYQTQFQGGYQSGSQGQYQNQYQGQAGPQNAYQAQNPYPNAQQPYQEDPTKNISLWSMVLGIASAALCWLGLFGIVGVGCGVAAIILALKAGKQSATGTRNNMATAGLICGIVGCVMGGFTFLSCVACIGCAGLGAFNGVY